MEWLPASEELLRTQSIDLALWAALVLGVLLITTLIYDLSPRGKSIVFGLITIAVLVPSTYFITAAIHLNNISATGGPVHWHADFRIFACGEELKPPQPPSALSNKVGTPLFHEHEDRRIHVEGVVADLEEVSLANFFRVQGGELKEGSFAIPTADGIQQFTDGDTCPSGAPGVWNVFLFKTDDGLAHHSKLTNYSDYILSPHSLVPPGDCLIFEFGPVRERTDYLCNFYQLATDKGDLEIIY